MATGLGHAAHPLELGAVEVVGTDDLGVAGLDALFALLEVVAVVALVGVDALVVNLDDFVADVVEEVAVVRHHEQRGGAAREVVLEPLDEGKVEVVGGLVEDEHVGGADEHIGQGYALELSAREGLDLLVIVGDVERGEYLLGTLLVVPRVGMLHAVEQAVEPGRAGGLEALLILANELQGVVGLVEAGLEHGQALRVLGLLA